MFQPFEDNSYTTGASDSSFDTAANASFNDSANQSPAAFSRVAGAGCAASHHGHEYVNELEFIPEVYEADAAPPPIPEKPVHLRRLPGNLMDASITDLVNLGNVAAAASALSSRRDVQQPSADSDYSNVAQAAPTDDSGANQLSVNKDEDVFVTPTNLQQPPELAPNAPVAQDPRKMSPDECARRPRSLSMPTFSHSHLSPVSLYRKYRPALLGDLPDDFLRLELSPKLPRSGNGGGGSDGGGKSRHPKPEHGAASGVGGMLIYMALESCA